MKFQLYRNRFTPGLKVLPMIWACAGALCFNSAISFTANAQLLQHKAERDTVINVAYGSEDRDQVTGAISTVSGAELYQIHSPSLTDALTGILPGITVMPNGGAPGFDDPSISIRGMHTTLNNGVLILVDGIQVNNINNMSPEEIESVSVLKDAAALALYGAKGANGVLLVTTKRGKASDKVNITFKARYGSQAPVQLPEFADSYDYARLYNEALNNDGLAASYTGDELQRYKSGADPYLYPNVNWYDEVLRKNSPLQEYSLTFNGGNNTAKYFVMAGFLDNQGLYAHTGQDRSANIGYSGINFRANVDLNITKSLSAQIGLGGNIQDRKFPPISTGDLWKNMATYAPNLYPVRTPEGQITGTANFPNNPVGYLLEKGYQSRHDRNIQTNVRITEKLNFITEGLDIFGAVLFDNLYQNRYDKTRNYAYYEPVKTTSSTGEDSIYYLQRGVDTDLTVSTGNDYENNRIIVRTGLDYNRSFNDHEVGGMVMFQQDKYTVLNNLSPFAMQNLAGRITYNFKKKYFAEAAFSYSGLENYPPGHRFGFFPAVSGGWLIHKEGFWKENNVVKYLKVRASAGMVGNDKGAPRFDYNQYWGIQNSQGYYFGSGQTWYNGLVQLGVANPDITWAKSLIYNAGIDAMLFGNKLSFTADFFHEKRDDILVNMSNVTPALSGYTAGAVENRGKVSNYGAEIETTFRDKAGDVDYFIGGQFSFARNKVINGYFEPTKEAYSDRDNHPVNQYFGLEAIGFFKDESDIANSPEQTFSIVRPGDLKYKDQNNDGKIDVNDEIAIGRQSYPEISYSINGGVTFKGFDLSFLVLGTANRSVYLNGYMFWPFVGNANISKWAVEGRWTPDTHAEATFPRLTTQSNDNNYRASTFWVRNVNTLRLRNVELGYTFGHNNFFNKNIENLRIYVGGVNLLSFDDLDIDVDPETLGRGYPELKTYTVGLSMNF